MSRPIEIPPTNADGDTFHSGSPKSPTSPTSPKLLIPSPIITRRQRTYSASERALRTPELKGSVKTFCRERGHGFILPKEGGEALFLHISDIEGEYVPKPGDEVSYRKTLVPPKMDKYQAVHVKITHLVPGTTHERWDAPFHPSSPSGKDPHH